MLRLLPLLLAVPSALAEPAVIRVGTIAPEGTTWVRELREAARAVERRTGGAVRLKAYPGAVLGDEREQVRQITLGRLEGAVLTTVGLEMAVPAMQVFHMPLLFESFAEVDGAAQALRPILDEEYARAGMIDAGIGPLGEVRVFSIEPATSWAALSRLRMWAWVDDPVQRQFFSLLGQKTVPLSLPDVRLALANRRVDIVYSTSLGLLGFQWHEHLKYASRETFVYAIGGVVLRKAAIDALPPAHGAVVVEECRRATDAIRRRAKLEEDQAYAVLRRGGMKETAVDADVMARVRTAATELRRRFGATDLGRRLLEAAEVGRRRARASAGR